MTNVIKFPAKDKYAVYKTGNQQIDTLLIVGAEVQKVNALLEQAFLVLESIKQIDGCRALQPFMVQQKILDATEYHLVPYAQALSAEYSALYGEVFGKGGVA
jgi:hypothetical protein